MELHPLWVKLLLIGLIHCTRTESPKATLTIEPDTQVFIGEKVTFSCIIQEGEDTEWTYDLFRDNKEFYQLYRTQEFITSSVTYSGKYTCRGRRKSDSQLSNMSDPVSLTVSEKPKLELTSSLTGDILTGNSVTLTCRMRPQSAGWKFYWNTRPNRTETETETFSYTISTVSDLGWYRCSAGRGNPVYYTDSSNAVWINVIESPKATLTIEPDTQVFIGEKVSFSCIIQEGENTEWTYDLFRDNMEFSQLYRTQEFNISSVTYSGKYTCRGRRKSDSPLSKMSDPVSLTVSGDSPPVALIINPSRTQHFTNDSLSMSCEDQSDSTGWTVRGYTHSEALFNCSSFSGSTCNIGSLSTSHTGVYWCQSKSGGRSNSVNITVHDGVVILDNPVQPVTEGHRLILRCLNRSMLPETSVDFYKNNSVLQSQTTGEMIIGRVLKSDEGFYHCKHPQKGESLKSWVSVRVSASGPTVVIIGLSLASVFVILLILVILMLRCRKKKGAKSQSPTVNQVTDQPTVDSATGSSSIIRSQVMTRRKKHNDDAAQGPHDVLHSQIEMKFVKPQRKDNSPLRPSDVVYATIKSKNKKPKDDDAEPSDMNYAEINLKKLTKPQRKQEKSSVGAETVYSGLKQNTDEGNFTAAADAPYAQVKMNGKKDNAEDIAKIADVTYAQVKRKGKRDIAGPW